jgi:CTP synthase
VHGLTRKKTRSVTLGITGKYTGLRDAYASIEKAVEHCTAALGCDAEMKWIDTTDITEENVTDRLAGLDAVIVPGGFGSRGVEGKIRCVQHCREKHMPYLGICLGFQVAVIEYARHVLGLGDADSTEFAPAGKNPVISELPEQKKVEDLGGSMRLGGQDIDVTRGTLASFLYGVDSPVSARGLAPGVARIRERFRHRYEVDPSYIARLEEAGMIFSGRHPVHPIMQIVELPPLGEPHGHPYFIGGQFHPELTSRPVRPQPLFMGLVAAAMKAKFPELAEPGRIDPVLSRWLRPAVKQHQPA